MKLAVDIETDGFIQELTQVHCAVAIDVDTGEKKRFNPHNIHKLCGYLDEADTLIMHNGLGFDIKALKKVFRYEPKPEQVFLDTLVLSRLYYPDIDSHSLEAWGKRLELWKGDYGSKQNAWDEFTPEMLEYCDNDTEITVRLYHHLRERMSGRFSKMSVDIEHTVAKMMEKQAETGVNFDLDKAKGLVEYVDTRSEEIYKEVRPHLRTERVVGNPFQQIFLKGGGYRKYVQEYVDSIEGGLPVAGPFTRISWEEPNLGSRMKIATQLLELGWKPTNYTDKGNPRITYKDSITGEIKPCPNLEEMMGDLGKKIAEFYVLKHRQSQIKGWIDNIRPDGRITAGVISNGTNTGRMTHKGVANVPRVTSIFGKEMRSLFIASEGKVMVGADLSGLELRCLAHYMDDPEYTDLILNDDIHIYNQKAAGLPTRDNAKTFIYGFLYGAGDSKIGSIVGGSSKAGKKLRDNFLQSLPSLADLISRVKNKAATGCLKAIDGRTVWLRRGDDGQVKTHTALNLLLQSAGAIIFKYSLMYIKERLIDKGYCDLLISYHDEVQVECEPKHKDFVSEEIVKCFELAGTLLKTKCPITGEAKAGKSWADTH